MTIQELTNQLASDPSNWESRLALVQALVAEGRHDSAVEAVNQGEALPHDAGAWLAAARTYAAVGAIEQARGLVASALEIDADYGPAKTYQAELEASLAPAPVTLTADDLDEEEVPVVAAAVPAVPIVRITGDKTPISLPKVAFASHEIDALREAEEEAERRRQVVIRRDKFNSLTITVLIHVAIFFALTLVATQVPPRVPPQIVASAAPPRPEESIESVSLDKPSLDPTTAVNTAVADIISVNATSSFSVSSVEVAISDVAVETGMEFTPSMTLGIPTSTESKMMFGQPMEGAGEVLGVILDVSGSMAEYLPAVIREVDKNFKDSPVVYARSMLFRKDRRDSEVRLIVPEEVIRVYKDRPDIRTPYAFLWDDLPRKAPQRYVDKLIETYKTRPNQFLMVGNDWDQNSTDAAIEFLLEQKVDSLYIFSDFEDFVDEDVAVELGQKLGRRKIRTFLQPAEKGSEFLDIMTKKIANKTLGRQLPSLVSLLRGTEEETEVTSLMPQQRAAEVSKLAGMNIKLATGRPALPEPPKDRTIIHKLSEPEYDAIFYNTQGDSSTTGLVEVFLKSTEGYIQSPIRFRYHSHKEIPDHPDPRYRYRARKFLRLAEEPKFDGKEIVWNMILEDELKFEVHLYLGRKGMNATYVAEPPKDGTGDGACISFIVPALAVEIVREGKGIDIYNGPDFPQAGVKLDIVREATKANEVVLNLPREELKQFETNWTQAGFKPGYTTMKYDEMIRVFPDGIRDMVVQGPSFGPRKIHARTTSGKVLLRGGYNRRDFEPWEGYSTALVRPADTRTKFTKTEAIELEIE